MKIPHCARSGFAEKQHLIYKLVEHLKIQFNKANLRKVKECTKLLQDARLTISPSSHRFTVDHRPAHLQNDSNDEISVGFMFLRMLPLC